jgi:hypothetical protein
MTIEPNPYSAPISVTDNLKQTFGWTWAMPMMLLAVIATLLVALPFMLALFTLLFGNTIGFIGLAVYRQRIAVRISALTILLLLFTLFFTNWGFSMPEPRVRIAWMYFIPACVLQLSLISAPIWLRNDAASNN